MKPAVKTAVKAVLSLAAGLILLYAGRLLSLRIVSVLFVNTGMSPETYMQAPAWLRYVWDNSDAVCNAFSLLAALAGGLYLRTLFPHEKTPLMFSHLFLGLMGAFMGIMLVRLLESMDCVRSQGAMKIDALSCIVDALACVVTAVLIRECACGGLGLRAAVIVSALLEAGVFAWLAGGFDIISIANGLIAGSMLAVIFVNQRTVFPEVLMCFGFRFGARRVAGFPGRVYPVSENWLSGGNNGLEGSVLLMLVFVMVAALFLLIRRKGKLNGQ